MKIILLVAADRGRRCLEKFLEISGTRNMIVFTFPETPWEPPFSERIEKFVMKLAFNSLLQIRSITKNLTTYGRSRPI